MKKTLPILFFGLMLCSQKGFAQDLNHIRANYKNAASNKTVCELLIKNLRDEKITNLELAYLGALETIWAKYVGNPFSKLSTFKKGKEKIEKAVKNAPNNPEIRYLRLSIQKKAPGILGYNDAIKTDELFLKNNLDKVSSKDLRKMIENILKG